MNSADWSGRRIHFIGVGGAGMSGLALVCNRLGASVSGSDRAESSYFRRVRAAGIDAIVGHDEANVPGDAEIVVSTAISEENPELALARRDGLRVLHRSDLLAELCASKRTIAVAGTHGKTTTTGMLIWAMRKMGLDPAFFVGGELPSVGEDGGAANSGWGEGEWAVVEADESDGSFLVLDPDIAIVTNIEMDHHSRWNGLAELRAAFAEFVSKAEGVALPVEETELPAALGDRRLLPFDLNVPGPDRVDLVVPGEHNLLDARAAIAGLELAGFDPVAGAEALSDFPGVRRRLEFKGEAGGTRIYDDYAHHPTEVKASLTALRELEPERLIAIFQPHLYSRTKVFSDAFGAALAVADEVMVLDVYAAREEPVGPFEGVSGLDVLRATADRAGGRPVWWTPDLEAAERAATTRLGAGRILVTIGAGDITRLSDRLVESGTEAG
ncbi:MAG TPA: Mur ligase domain-containing protein [Solirubrobacterales bacterium]|nr:Mur ligase domain-containing protein [Solirubrobacterales bacterium]